MSNVPVKTSKEIAITVFRELAQSTHIEPSVRLNAAQSLMEFAIYEENPNGFTSSPEVKVD